MRKFLIIPSLFLMASLLSCSSENGKVNVIKGPGSANNSHIVSFNEVCSGEIEGFLGETDQVLVSKKTETGQSFSVINLTSKEQQTLISTKFDKNYSIEISADGSRVIIDNMLIDVESGKSEQLQDIEFSELLKPADFPTPPSYSFINGAEVVLTDPFYYLMKYYSSAADFNNLSNALHSNKIKLRKIGDPEPKKEILKDFSEVESLNISYLKQPTLLPDELKYIFIGYVHNTKNTPLYIFNLFEKNFSLIDDNVKLYSVSHDKKQVAYIKSAGKHSNLDTLYIINVDGSDKQNLVSLPCISGVEWSRSSNWIAFSGGEKTMCDISIIKSDGTQLEQLTNGMNSTKKFSWSYAGDKIAFTSAGINDNSVPKVYIIKLNIENSSHIIKSTVENAEKTKFKELLIETLKKETQSKMVENLNQS